MEGAEGRSPDLGPTIAQGDWAGWRTWTGNEPFEEYVGPFYARRGADSRMECAFRAEPKTMNGGGSVHGGALMAFADYSLFMIAYDELRGVGSVTVSLSGEFIAAAPAGARLTSRGEVLKVGGSLMFIRGLIDHGGETVLNFSGVLRLFRRKG